MSSFIEFKDVDKIKRRAYILNMHIIQLKILKLSESQNLAKLTLRDIAKGIGMPDGSPQKIKHHLLQLQKKGFLRINKIKGIVEKTALEPGWAKGLLKKAAKLFSIPIIGTANCGPATIFAEQNFEGFLRISNKLIGRTSPNGLFAIKANGASMNRATIDEKNIEDGDFIIIDSRDKNIKNRDIVVAIFDNKATVKRFIEDKPNNQIVLKADSSFDYEPIYLHQDDNFYISGKAIKIIKKPQLKLID